MEDDRRYRFDVDQYVRMSEAGVLAADARVELIDGNLIEKAREGSRHFSVVCRLGRSLIQATDSRIVVSIRQPLQLDCFNLPEPDLVVLRPRQDFYAEAYPTGIDTLLVIEVADSTYAFDLRTKARLYATHGVAVYWVVDLQARLLHVHSAPDGNAYRGVSALADPRVMSLPGLPDTAIDLTGLL